MKTYTLSKSTYIRGLQCLKSLYLNKHRSYLRDKLSEEQLAKFTRGHTVGKLAQQLFPGGIEMARPGVATADKTQQFISEGIPVIYEACFLYNDVLIAIDILVRSEYGWNAYEVKSSGALSETYYNDAYIKDYVIRGSGLNLNSFFLVYRDSSIEIEVNSEVSQLFKFEQLPPKQAGFWNEIESELSLMKETLNRTHSPDIAPGKQCMNPYPCDFRGICWKGKSEEEIDALLAAKESLGSASSDPNEIQ